MLNSRQTVWYLLRLNHSIRSAEKLQGQSSYLTRVARLVGFFAKRLEVFYLIL
jgi:hypothetical protein